MKTNPSSTRNTVYRFIILLTLLTGTEAFAQQTQRTSTYFINEKEVTAKEFDKFLSGLKEIKNTWYCAETNEGGRTGYDAKDFKGNVYEYRAESDQKSTKNTISKKHELK